MREERAPARSGPREATLGIPMSFSPLTKLVYVPVQTQVPLQVGRTFQQKALGFNVGIDFAAAGLPQQPEIKKAILNATNRPSFAWDPCSKKKSGVSIVQPSPTRGTLCTAGNLVFEGTAQGNLEAYRADNVKSSGPPTRKRRVCRSHDLHSQRRTIRCCSRRVGGVFALAGGEVALSSVERKISALARL